MARALAHRGPDGQATWISPSARCGLAHRRLAIIDLSADADQPMLSEDSRFALAFNGEIYNYVELRSALVAKGVQFKTKSDTEVLLEALIYWGPEEALRRVTGMFAFAFWDEKDRSLVLARDALGEKPLYFRSDGRNFHFASELKALRESTAGQWTICQEALSHYLSLGYVPHPYLIWQEVEMVPAGHWLTLNHKGERHLQSFWRPPAAHPRGKQPDLEELEHLIADAVRLRLRADVPVGVFLSGGIDSGLITAFAASAHDCPINTITVGFEDEADETEAASAVARRYGTRHQVLRLSPNLEQLLLDSGATFDHPLGDPACLLTYAIAAETRKHVKVVLNGEGGDELFGGYRRHLASWWTSALRLNSRPIRVTASTLCNWLPDSTEHRSSYFFVRRAVRGLATDEARRYLAWGSDGFSDEEKAELMLHPGPSTIDLLRERLSLSAEPTDFRRFMKLDLEMAMSDGLLPKLDLATMAHGLEGRCPFLDPKLIELAATYNDSSFVSPTRTKRLLRRIAHRLLPRDVASAPKRGFELPLVRWLRGPLRRLSREICLQDGGICGSLVHRESVERLFDQPRGLDDNQWARRIYVLLSLANWHQQHA